MEGELGRPRRCVPDPGPGGVSETGASHTPVLVFQPNLEEPLIVLLVASRLVYLFEASSPN